MATVGKASYHFFFSTLNKLTYSSSLICRRCLIRSVSTLNINIRDDLYSRPFNAHNTPIPLISRNLSFYSYYRPRAKPACLLSPLANKPLISFGLKRNQTADAAASADGGAKKSRWSNWTGKNAWKLSLVFLGVMFGGMSGVIVYSWGAPELDQDGHEMVRDPTSEKLLPDPLPPPYIQPPYTLVLELTDLLLKPQWDMKMGWRFKKRPGLDLFLQQCHQSGYEIVIFTKEPANIAYALTASMDPQGVIWYRLFKEDTRYTSGVHIKDLNCLNRDLKRVILVDVDKQAYKLNPRNGIALIKWNGSDDDRELYDLAAFLSTVATNKIEDVRTVLQYYNEFDDPMAKFRENQATVMKTQEELMKIQEEEKKKKILSKSPFLPADLRKR